MCHCPPIAVKSSQIAMKFCLKQDSILMLFKAFFPQLEDIGTLKYSSDNFPKRPDISGLMENCQNYISMHCCPPIVGRLT